MGRMEGHVLSKLGFVPSADFSLNSGELELNVFENSREKGVYAFVLDGTVKYVGETRGEFYRRVYFYKNPGPSQHTNIRVNQLLIRALRSSKDELCQVWFLADHRISRGTVHLEVGGSVLEEVPDRTIIERVLIRHLQPEWNRR